MQATQIKVDENNEKENINYFINLREHIVEALNCIFSAVKDYNKTKEFIPYVNAIVSYILFISEDYASSTSIIKGRLFLIYDFCYCYKNDILAILNIDIIKNMINKIESDTNLIEEEEIEIRIQWAKTILRSVFN